MGQHGNSRTVTRTDHAVNDTIDTDYVAIDRFMSTVFWHDADIAFSTALIDAIDEWAATVSAEHHNSQPFSTSSHSDPLAASLHELLAAVAHLSNGARPGLTVMHALSEAASDWQHN